MTLPTKVMGQIARPLYIPGIDPQPINAAVIGVDSKGRTTYQLENGAFTGTWEYETDIAFPATLTLVEGPDYASLNYADPGGQFVVQPECTLTGQFAKCSMRVSTGVTTATEAYTLIPVLIVATTTPGPTAQSHFPTMGNGRSPAGINSSMGGKLITRTTAVLVTSGVLILSLLHV
ncbi:hypothetical protein AX17_004180 [Amanita inopinata Kibby_2008]|nr:hypothetical protein AX17_004180 [Amanita inopinata Kibby_2008]